MSNSGRSGKAGTIVPRAALALAALALAGGCSERGRDEPNETAEGPFESMEAVARASATFSEPRAGVPLSDGGVAFLATIEGASEEENETAGERVGVLLLPNDGAPRVLYAGDKLVNPFDIDVSPDQSTLYIADASGGAENEGAILTLPVVGGEPAELSLGRAPRSVTVGRDGKVYFSGVDDESGEPAVFVIDGDGPASALYQGAPLVDPSGIALRRDSGVLVVDTRLFDAEDDRMVPIAEAGVILLADGEASVIASGFATGFPAGLALTLDEKTLLVSGEGPDRSDTVYLVDMSNPSAEATPVTGGFSEFQDSSAGLKRAHDSDVFVWASLAEGGGTVYRIVGRR